MSKILFVSGWYPTDDRPSFGIFVKRHAEAAALNNEVSVLYVRMISSPDKKIIEVESRIKNNLFETIISINKSKLGFPPLSSLLKSILFVRALIKGYKIIAARFGKPDLIHANILYEGGRQALLLKLLYGIPFVCTEHWTGYLPEDGTYRGMFKKFISRLTTAKAEFVLPVTEQLSSSMQSLGLKGNYTVIPNVVNTKVFFPDGSIKKNKNQVIHISSLDERQKNFNGILNAFTAASKTNNELKLIVIGGDANIVSAKKMAAAKNITPDKIYFTGYLEENKIVNLLRESACLILFSNYETQGCVILESLACGAPVISSDLPAVREAVNENNIILINAGDENKLADALALITKGNHPYSPEELSRFIQANYSFEKVNILLNAIYKSALEYHR